MGEKAIARLAKAIGYPQEIPAEADAFDFIVDGAAVRAEMADGEVRGAGEGDVRIMFSTALTEDEDAAVHLAGYAAGRLMKEDAVLAWDPERRAAILWMQFEGRESALPRAFETFCASADWWRERVDEAGAPLPVNALLIRP